MEATSHCSSASQSAVTSTFVALAKSGLVDPADLVELGFAEAATALMVGEAPAGQLQHQPNSGAEARKKKRVKEYDDERGLLTNSAIAEEHQGTVKPLVTPPSFGDSDIDVVHQLCAALEDTTLNGVVEERVAADDVM